MRIEEYQMKGEWSGWERDKGTAIIMRWCEALIPLRNALEAHRHLPDEMQSLENICLVAKAAMQIIEDRGYQPPESEPKPKAADQPVKHIFVREVDGVEWEVTPEIAFIQKNGAHLLHQCLVQRDDKGNVSRVIYRPVPALSDRVTQEKNVEFVNGE